MGALTHTGTAQHPPSATSVRSCWCDDQPSLRPLPERGRQGQRSPADRGGIVDVSISLPRRLERSTSCAIPPPAEGVCVDVFACGRGRKGRLGWGVLRPAPRRRTPGDEIKMHEAEGSRTKERKEEKNTAQHKGCVYRHGRWPMAGKGRRRVGRKDGEGQGGREGGVNKRRTQARRRSRNGRNGKERPYASTLYGTTRMLPPRSLSLIDDDERVYPHTYRHKHAH